MFSQKPIAILHDTYLMLAKNNIFSMDIKNFDSKQMFLVIDIYAMKNPVHPQGHPGWFRFDQIEDGKLCFTVKESNNKNGIVVSSNDNIPLIDCWCYTQIENLPFPLEIHVVIRKRINNEILFEDKIICFETEHDYFQYKNEYRNIHNVKINLLPIKQIIPRNLFAKIVVRTFADGDAVGYFAREMAELLLSQGIKNRIYVQNCESAFRPFVKHYEDLLNEGSHPNDLIIYHYSISDAYLDNILNLKCKKIVYFHGVTSPDRLRVFDAELSNECSAAIKEVYKLVKFDAILVNSEQNKRVLLNAYKTHEKERLYDNRDDILLEERMTTISNKIYVIPPVLFSGYSWNAIEADLQFQKTVEKLGKTLLYVGKLYPHKRIDDLIEVFKETLDLNNEVVLLLVGHTHKSYMKYIMHKIENLPQETKERIIFMHMISRNQLKAAYNAANIFITMSEDEGFCVPVLEAMRFHIPVVARKTENTPVDEVLGEAGKYIVEKDYKNVAAEIDMLFRNADYYNAIVERQDKELERYQDNKLMIDFMERILECYYEKTTNSF